ncbi:acyl-ACP--UDP-N-acetylglucosamine O-acyltransferase [Candidatus Thiodictyon syntrophicum]|uniref:Acyl-[acyl-carrier-protein]--UDP-N-acetylglucosamine O-acyltransferase n=1 Tax=Candidatus Thiodictyon syntrophicum TaxID=1166950 RepID=A0A2K8UD04_9GAMM|nr:acyl-ACP--UDP-N-acetylglucosamine O-acyltransferase [Candidatus Thiodictyon syntrophicum]AUB83319.1 acyl-[acyl-carrier-protein]--UDP-N-acetylglucosamine O-acyltransferase [Candidatus Thiodictyon syntrophicum]
MIHPSAVIDPGARLAAGVDVGPFAVIGPGVEIGEGTRVGPHTVIRGPTRIGRDNRIFQFASVGEDPQDMKYGGEETRLEIGDRNQIRECATLHRGTVQDQGVTRVGDDNLFMAYTHVAHDCRIGNHVIMANAASLGGHVEIQDWAILGGFTIVHQFCRLGAHSFCAMGSALSKDVPPYVTVGGQPAAPHGINSEGLRRRGFSPAAIAAIKRAYRALYLAGLKLDEALERIGGLAAEVPEVAALAAFVAERGRGIVR